MQDIDIAFVNGQDAVVELLASAVPDQAVEAIGEGRDGVAIPIVDHFAHSPKLYSRLIPSFKSKTSIQVHDILVALCFFWLASIKLIICTNKNHTLSISRPNL